MIKLENVYLCETNGDSQALAKEFHKATGYAVPRPPVNEWFAFRLSSHVDGCIVIHKIEADLLPGCVVTYTAHGMGSKKIRVKLLAIVGETAVIQQGRTTVKVPVAYLSK